MEPAAHATYMLRHLRPEDRRELLTFHDRCSERTHQFRFFNAKRHLTPREGEYLCGVDGHERGALVWTEHDHPDVIHGVGRWDGLDQHTAEIAFVIEDSHQGYGLGRTLVTAVIEAAKDEGFDKLTAEVLGENGAMRHLLRSCGYGTDERFAGSGEVSFSVDLRDLSRPD
jgi:RimJ/RimL family protein N-acetyltransferase